jgi:hypothetical protein
MKKIIALFVLMLGISFTASAQETAKTTTTAESKEAAIQKAAIEDAKALNEFIPLSNDQMQSFKGLFESKHRVLAEANLSEDRKKSMTQTIEAKISATLTPEQFQKLSQNQTLLKQLTGK